MVRQFTASVILAIVAVSSAFASSADPQQKPATTRYKNDRYAISLEYPDKYEFASGAQMSKVPCSILNGDKPQGNCVTLATLTIPASAYPNTDFVSASVEVSVNEKLDLNSCEHLLDSSSNGASSALINGVPFKKAMLGQTGSPGIVDNTTGYISYKNDICYEITVEYGGTPAAVGGSNGKATIVAVDYSEVGRQLQAILRTLRIGTVRRSE